MSARYPLNSKTLSLRVVFNPEKYEVEVQFKNEELLEEFLDGWNGGVLLDTEIEGGKDFCLYEFRCGHDDRTEDMEALRDFYRYVVRAIKWL